MVGEFMKKRNIIIVILVLVVALIGTVTFYFLNRQDTNTLTILEKQWIEDNKNNKFAKLRC